MKISLVLCMILFATGLSLGQDKQIKLGLIGIDSYAPELDPTRTARVELEKLGIYEIIDRYDLIFMLESEKLDYRNCFGKMCLVEAGKAIHADMMFTGSVDSFSDRIVVSLRLVNVKEDKIEKTETLEFYHYPQEIDRMIEVAIKKMYNASVDFNFSETNSRPDKI